MDSAACRRAERKDQTRVAISDAAWQILWAEGTGKLTASHIAERAGVSRRTFFNYFPSVEAYCCRSQGGAATCR